MGFSKSEMFRGFTEAITLDFIGLDGDYIYNIVKKIRERSKGFFEISNPSMLLVMKKLLSMGLVFFKNELNERGVNRKRYFLTAQGIQYQNEVKAVCIHGANVILGMLKGE